ALCGERPASVLHQGVAEAAHEEDLDAAPALLVAEEARRDDAGVVEDEERAPREQLIKVADGGVSEGSRGRIEDQEARAVALGRGPRSDQLRRELVVEESSAHAARISTGGTVSGDP